MPDGIVSRDGDVGYPMTTSADTHTARPRRLLRDDIRQWLHEAILSGELKPGDQIVETKIAREFGTSQGPVREALREMEQSGLIDHHPHRGAFVRHVSADDAWELYTLRAHLEVMAVRLALPLLKESDFARMESLLDEMRAAARGANQRQLTEIDVAFHGVLFERAGHRLLERTWRSMNPLSWTMFTLTVLDGLDLAHAAERHRPIIAALGTRDEATAEAAITDHLLALGASVRRHLAS